MIRWVTVACVGLVALGCEREPGEGSPPTAAPERPAALTVEAATAGSVDRLFRDCATEELPEEIGRFSKCGTADKRHLHVLDIINRHQKADASKTPTVSEAWRREGAKVELGELTVDGVTWKTILARGFANGQSEQMSATLSIDPQGVRSIICGDPKSHRCSEIVRRAIARGLTPIAPPSPAKPRALPEALVDCAARQLKVAETSTFIAECSLGPVASVVQVETSSAFKGVASRLWETQLEDLRAAKQSFTEVSITGGAGKALRKQNRRGAWIVEAHVEDTPYRMRTITCEERLTTAPTTSPAPSAQTATDACAAVIEALVGAPPPYAGVPDVAP